MHVLNTETYIKLMGHQKRNLDLIGSPENVAES